MMRPRKDRQRGAAMVEMALVLPLLLLLVFGIMEAGWLFAQQVEVRNAAREGARLAVVDYPNPGSGNADLIAAEVCARASLSGDGGTVAISENNNGTPAVSEDDSAIVTISQPYVSLTGFIPSFNNLTITSTAEMRIERDSVTWGALTTDPWPCT